ncbi:FAD-dependent oxidoreductase [Streptomyces sp. HC44]|uniref:FAD-dependent oxidoreductase n=1 Tax=Streptomyces scabichelini TaxID=2711217 RepID=A0A6G4UX85_9ACTN|nr:FAD/NAD(P)-binding protein [Streptomyces scabichelini]NGO06285.1 FAD-dependent oxidoreductase [Streptomyces scabichelini]
MDIAIVGGGAAAVGLLDALAATEGEPAVGETGTITVFEPSPQLWRGRPYGPDLDSVLVNAPPAIMSIRNSDFGHYAAWLGDRGADHIDELLGLPLVPRALYGEYLAHTAEKAIAALGEQGRLVRVVAARVTEVVRSGARLVLRTHDTHDPYDTQEHEATHVALCVGGGTPPDPYGLDEFPGFTTDPYPLADTLDHVPAGGDVAIIGSGLTAVDVVVSLAARGHQGRITLLSRSGVLPHVWQRPDDRRPRHVTAERVAGLHQARGNVTLDDLVGLLRRELADAGEDFDELAAELRGTEAEDPVQRLRRQIAAVDDPRIGRRVLQETAHTVGPYVWRLLPEADRAWLRRHLRTATSVASPMVPVNASVLMRLLDSGQLAVTRGVHAIEPVNGWFRVRDDDGERTAEIVVNAVNPPPQAVPAAARHLVRSLVSAGLATLHPSGGLIPADPRVHVVGDLTGGGSFITSSIPGVAAQASRTAQALRTISAAVQPPAPGRP